MFQGILLERSLEANLLYLVCPGMEVRINGFFHLLINCGILGL